MNEKVIKENVKRNDFIKKLKYKVTCKNNYEKLVIELKKEFKKPKPKFVGFFSFKPKHEYDLTFHCYNLDHINYICDIEKVEWLFCPICKIKTIIAYNSQFTIPYETKEIRKHSKEVIGISIDKYWEINQKILEKYENLSNTPFQTRDELLDHISGIFKEEK